MFRCYLRLQTPALVDTPLRDRYSIFDQWHPRESADSNRDVL